MKRRSFVKLIAGASILSVGGYVALPSFESTVNSMIRYYVKDLNIVKEQVDKFIVEATAEKYWKQFSRSKQEFIRVHFLTENKIIILPYGNKYRQYKDEIIGRFLMSTDFFVNKMESGREIRYTGFYNPYKMPCFNPFTNNYYEL